jgi:hypothetical protein
MMRARYQGKSRNVKKKSTKSKRTGEEMGKAEIKVALVYVEGE